ncbi:MAG: putative LPS assembly protein LptD [Prevotellaceae bacterium]|nr:putative LPS assembly protein LptD [Prevotellaceae bacterium]
MPSPEGEDSLNILPDTIISVSTEGEPDTLSMDSLQLAVYHHNKAVDDSIRADSINSARSNTLEAPVTYSGTDSLVYDAATGMAYLYGDANVKYQDMDLTSDIINMNNDNNTVFALGRTDSLGNVTGAPDFKQGQDEYQSDTISFNFKTKKGFISNVYTAQQDGFLTSAESKRSDNGELFLKHGTYTTCDKAHPDFYLALSRAKVRPGKEVFFGPAYMVVADVPIPFAIPYGFFPFTKSYSSGLIMPTYGDETERGFYLRDGGYYFAISDKMDLKLIGEIYTKGSWGVTASSNYRRRYKYSGSFLFSYQNSQTGEKNMPDFSKTESFKVQWSHRQDSKANPFSTLSASVNFASTSYERNNLTSMYNPTSMTQSTRTSSVSYSTGFSSIGLSLSTTFNLAQNMRDSTIALTLPDLNISISRFYPFRRKHAAGKERWYEKIAMSYTGQLSNSITSKEDKIMKASIIKDWRNGMQHSIPISGSFTIFDYINVSPSFNFTDRMYSNKINRSWDEGAQREVCDTVYGFNNVYNWNFSISANTKLYGFYVPNKKIFGDKIVAVRHVLTPSVSYSYAPDFSTSSYGYWETYTKTDANGNVSLVSYSPYSNGLYGVPGKGKTGSISVDLGNNVEMKIRSDKDSTGYKKISIIDELGLSMSYNMAAEKRPLSDLSTRIRLKLSKSYTFNLNAVFATYAYELDENGKPYIGERTEYSYGRFGRFQGMSQNLSYTFNNQTFKKISDWLHGRNKDEQIDETQRESDEDDVNTNEDPVMNGGRKQRGSDMAKALTDEDGYLTFSMPWSLSVSYGITMRENTGGKFNTSTMRYPYKFTQNMNFSGNITIAKGWNINFTSGYDFENHKISMTTASLARDLHCFGMSCSVVLAPYTSYNFSFRCNAATLTDALKYDKRSSYSNTIKWY